METASLYIQQAGVVLSGAMSIVIISDERKTPCRKGRGKDVNCRKVYYSSRYVSRIKIRLNDIRFEKIDGNVWANLEYTLTVITVNITL